MKRQIRKGVFETNSSSTHSLVMCLKSDYDKWEHGDRGRDNDKGNRNAVVDNALDRIALYTCDTCLDKAEDRDDWD